MRVVTVDKQGQDRVLSLLELGIDAEWEVLDGLG